MWLLVVHVCLLTPFKLCHSDVGRAGADYRWPPRKRAWPAGGSGGRSEIGNILQILEIELQPLTYSGIVGSICGNLKGPIQELCDRQRKLHSISKNHMTDTTPRRSSCFLFATAFFLLRHKNSLCSGDPDAKLCGAESNSE